MICILRNEIMWVDSTLNRMPNNFINIHCFCRFRNSIPEIELNVDVLPPFRDDIRLTVPEYRSKLYEIVQVPGERRQSDLSANNTSKQR